jgi:hypothetical protein
MPNQRSMDEVSMSTQVNVRPVVAADVQAWLALWRGLLHGP